MRHHVKAIRISDCHDTVRLGHWHIRIDPDKANGLLKTSAIDALQVRGVATERLIRKLGRLSASTMDEIVAATAAVIEYE